MTQRERRLGKGLDSLIGIGKHDVPAPVVGGRGPERVPLDLIDPNPWQPRREFGEAELEDLIRSIQRHGVLQPILLRRTEDRYQIVAGERRWRASQELGTGSINAVVVGATNRDMLEWSIVENVQRADLNPIEAGLAYQRLMTEFELTQEDVAERVGQSRSHIANTVRLLDLPDEIRDFVSRGTISAGAAKALLSVKNPADQLRLARETAAGTLNVRQLEALGGAKPKAEAVSVSPKRADANLTDLGDQIQAALAMRVKVTGSPKKGTVAISFHSVTDLAKIHRLLMAAAEIPPADDEVGDMITV